MTSLLAHGTSARDDVPNEVVFVMSFVESRYADSVFIIKHCPHKLRSALSLFRICRRFAKQAVEAGVWATQLLINY